MGKGIRYSALLLCGSIAFSSGCSIFSGRGNSPTPTPPVYSAGPLPSAPMNPLTITDPSQFGLPPGTIIYPGSGTGPTNPLPELPKTPETLPMPKGGTSERDANKTKSDLDIPTIISEPNKSSPPELVIPTTPGMVASTPKTETKPSEGTLGSGLKIPPTGPSIPGPIPPTEGTSKPLVDPFAPANKLPGIVTPAEVTNTPKIGSEGSDVLPIPPSMKMGRDAKFGWVVGTLDKHHKGYWTLRYADFGDDDSWGGKVRLSDDPRLTDLKDGDTLFVEGELLVPTSWKPDSNTPYPPFRIKGMKKLPALR